MREVVTGVVIASKKSGQTVAFGNARVVVDEYLFRERFMLL